MKCYENPALEVFPLFEQDVITTSQSEYDDIAIAPEIWFKNP